MASFCPIKIEGSPTSNAVKVFAPYPQFNVVGGLQHLGPRVINIVLGGGGRGDFGTKYRVTYLFYRKTAKFLTLFVQDCILTNRGVYTVNNNLVNKAIAANDAC